MGVFQVFPFESLGIGKNSGRFLEGDAVLRQIPGGFSGIPNKHINVYTIMGRWMSRERRFRAPCGFESQDAIHLEIAPLRFVDFDSLGQYKNF